jgi:hypothetical protein
MDRTPKTRTNVPLAALALTVQALAAHPARRVPIVSVNVLANANPAPRVNTHQRPANLRVHFALTLTCPEMVLHPAPRVVPVSTKVAKLIARIVLLENIAMVKLTQPALHALATHTLQQEHQSVPIAQPVSTVMVQVAITALKVRPVQLEALVSTVPLVFIILTRGPSHVLVVLLALSLIQGQRPAPNVVLVITTHTLATVSAFRAMQAHPLLLLAYPPVLIALQASTQQPEMLVLVVMQVSTPQRRLLRALAVQQARTHPNRELRNVLIVLRESISLRLARRSA